MFYVPQFPNFSILPVLHWGIWNQYAMQVCGRTEEHGLGHYNFYYCAFGEATIMAIACSNR